MLYVAATHLHIAMSLLRFVDPSSGKIWLDGLDITTVGLKDLRSRVVSLPILRGPLFLILRRLLSHKTLFSFLEV